MSKANSLPVQALLDHAEQARARALAAFNEAAFYLDLSRKRTAAAREYEKAAKDLALIQAAQTKAAERTA